MIVIHHNPNCGTSRKVLAILNEAGADPVVIDYRTQGWTRAQLLGLFAAAGLTPAEALRVNGTRAVELGLPGADDETILAAMVADPMLVNRPFVCTPNGVRLCRPAETVRELLDQG